MIQIEIFVKNQHVFNALVGIFNSAKFFYITVGSKLGLFAKNMFLGEEIRQTNLDLPLNPFHTVELKSNSYSGFKVMKTGHFWNAGNNTFFGKTTIFLVSSIV